MRLTTSSQVGDKVLWLCCAGLHVAAGTGSAPCQSPASNTFEVFPCSYWIDNLGFTTEGKLTAVLICFQQNTVRMTNSSQVGDKVLWLCCAGLHVTTSTGSAPCQSSASNTFGVFPCSYWIDNLGFITERNLLLCSLYLPLGVPQRARIYFETSCSFFGAAAGESRTSSQGESLITNLFTLLFLFCLVSFFALFACFVLQKTQKISFTSLISYWIKHKKN